jgi:hypothetical protein
MKKMLKSLVIFLLALLAVHSAEARKIYVSSSTGDDSRTITQAQNQSTPWASLAKVQSSLTSSITAGDSILFKKGDKFAGSINIQSKTGLYFGSYGTGDKPLFWGTGSTISALFRVRTCTSMVFRGLSVSDTTISPTDRTVQAKIQNVFVIEASSTGVTVKDIKMDRIGYGVYMTRTSPGQTVDSCDIGNLRMIRNTPTSVNPDDDYGGVPIQISGRNNTITNNYFHDCWSQSYDYGFDGGGIEFFEEGDTIMNNIIAYNTFYDNNGTFEHGSSSDGVANNPIMNNKFYYNKIINCSSLFYINNNGQYKTYANNLQFYNNVIIQTVTSRTGNLRLASMAVNEARSGIVVFRNNIFQVSNGASVMRAGQWDAGQLTHTNNIFKLSNGSVTNITLDNTDISTSTVLWTNTTNTNPIFWDLHLTPTSIARGRGVNVSLTRDFEGNVVSGIPDIGVYQFTGTLPLCTFTYGAWSSCTNGIQNRSYVGSPTGCTGQPPTDSIIRTCTVVCTSFVYGQWSSCSNGVQTRTYTSVPQGCSGTPPADSISRACTTPPDSCLMTLAVVSIRSASCLNTADGNITIGVKCGSLPFTYILTYPNGQQVIRTTTLSQSTFNNLLPQTYRITVQDANGNQSSLRFTIKPRRRRNC